MGEEVRDVRILGVRLRGVTAEMLNRSVMKTIRSHKKAIVANVNAHALNIAVDNPRFREFLNKSDLVFCDGFGVMWAARLLGRLVPHRVTPPDWMDGLARMACTHAFTLFFLGARPGTAERAAAVLRERIPGLRVVGVHHGYFDATPGSQENEAVIREINSVKPDILILGLGMPLQEFWLAENWFRLEAKVAITAGAIFEYISGERRRAPRWMTDHGFEWLGRLLVEPRRLWRRYLVGNPLFAWRVVKEGLGLMHFEE